VRRRRDPSVKINDKIKGLKLLRVILIIVNNLNFFLLYMLPLQSLGNFVSKYYAQI
jgi:hypothetical protein